MTETAFIKANNLTIHIKADADYDDPMPVIFINSLGSDLRIWDGVVHKFYFEAQYRLIRYDKRGHGLSDCPDAPYTIRDHTQDLVGVMDALDIQVAVLVGISVGGMIAMDFAAQYPARVKALVLSDTFPKIGTADMWNTRIDSLRTQGMASLGTEILARWFAPSYQEQNPAAYCGYYNMLTRMPVTGYTGTCEAIRDADLSTVVQAIDCPTLVMCGAEDGSTPPELVQGLVDLMPNARYIEIRDAGHLPCIENPDFMASRIQHFLNEVL